MPIVSVLLPAYNASGTLDCALRSLLRQTLSDLEIVAVDDGSTDGTLEILERYAEDDPRVRPVRGSHQGIIGSLDLGLSRCRGEFLARMDADDVSHPKRLEMQVEMLRSRPEISVCSSRVSLFPLVEVREGLKRYVEWSNGLMTPEEIERDMFVESPVVHPSVMLRTAELIEIGGYEEHGWPEDYDLWLRHYIRGKRFAKVPQTLTFWRVGPERLTFTDSRYSVENFLRGKAHYLAMKLRADHPEITLWGAGMIGRRLSKHLIREGMAIAAVIDIDPKKIGRTMRGIPIVPPDYLLGNTDAFVVTAVGSLGARPLIRENLKSMGRTEGRDFICVA